ncbi:unnamed protein product [Rotaria magnacalcarata]|uniref:Uncharacterized protein n=1 Tax=Rotaria magnacalcarata TaxID=392030 RepID=A0A816U694_9BILA|nr:unnamed protein product [Rotaria magnacalcarata]
MTSHYIENESNANQYYFDANNKATAQVQRLAHDATYASPVTVSTTIGPSEFSPYPVGVSGVRSPTQQIRSDQNGYVGSDPYQISQQHQSVAGFNKSVSQQQYQSSSSPVPQVKATMRTINSPEQQHASPIQYQQQQQSQSTRQPQQQIYANYEQQGLPQSSQVLTEHQQHQYDSRQQLGQSTGVSAFYQAPSSAQYTHHDVDQRTESLSRGRDPNVQVQQVPIRQIPVSSHQQNDTSASYQQQSQQHVTSQPSPKQAQPQQQHEDQLQQYYSQLTPEQYQQLLRQEQIQRQQQEEQKRQQLAQQQYYLQQQQERQRTEQQQQNKPSRSNQEGQHYEEHQERRVYQNSPIQEQQHRPQGQDQHDAYNYRPQPVQTTVLTNNNQDSYRQQQHQHGQQGQPDAYYEQQRRVASQQSPSPSTYQHEQQHRSTVTIGEGQQQQITSNQQQHARIDSGRQYLDEQEYYAAQLARQQQQERERLAQIEAAQHVQQQEREYIAQPEATQHQQTAQRVQFQPQPQQQHQEQPQQQQTVQPVGIRGLMNKFTGPTKIPTYESKNKTATSHQYSSSSHTSSPGTGQTTTTKTTQSSKICSMTYSALPKPQEPPVNSVEYYKMMQQGNVNSTSSNVQQTAGPPHIQGPAPGFGALRERFKGVSVSESTDPIHDIRRQQQQQSNAGSSSLGSLRDQYVNRAKESTQSQEESFSQRIQSVSRSTVASNQSAQHQQPITLVQHIPQEEELQVQSQSVDDQVISSDGAVAEGGSSSGASPIDNDTNLVTAEAI